MVRSFATIVIVTLALGAVSSVAVPVAIQISPEEARELYERGFFSSIKKGFNVVRKGIKTVAKIARPALPLIGAVNPVLGAAATAAQFIREEPQYFRLREFEEPEFILREFEEPELSVRDVDETELSLREFDDPELALRWLEESGFDIRDFDERNWFGDIGKNIGNVAKVVSKNAGTISNFAGQAVKVAQKVASNPMVQTAVKTGIKLLVRDGPDGPELYIRDVDGSEFNVRELYEPELDLREFDESELDLRDLQDDELEARDMLLTHPLIEREEDESLFGREYVEMEKLD